jgi:hypothetical protein
MAYAMEEETTMMMPSQGMEEDMSEGIASLPEQGDSGIADLPQAAQQLAQLGRAQDTFLGHLSQDEVVIPRELLQASPELEDMIRNAFEAEGMDYTQYVVGSDENSINPETGLPEFFVKKFVKKVKKAVKGAGKAVKKAVKKVEKEVVRKPIKKIARELKRAAPVVLPIALNFVPGIGPIMAAGLGSGIGTLIQGGDINDALKRAAVAAAFAGVAQGIQKGMAKPTTTGAEAGVPVGTETTTASTMSRGPAFGDISVDAPSVSVGTQPTLSVVPPAETITAPGVLDVNANISKLTPTPNADIVTKTIAQRAQEQAALDAKNKIIEGASFNMPKAEGSLVTPDSGAVYGNLNEQFALPSQPIQTPVQPSITDRIAAGYNKAKDVASRAGDYMFRGGKTELEVEAAKKAAGDKYIQDRLAQGIMPTEQGLLAAEAAAGPSALARFGPSAALGVGALYASGAFKTPEEEMDPEYVAMQQQLAEDRAIAANIPQMGSPAGIDYITGAQTLAGAPNYQYLNPLYQGGYFLNNPTLNTGITMAKGGGEMAVTNLDVSKFPRRTGRISGPGTETSDSIPAMLSDGEFVMNARAVRGAGNGSREAGVRKMYDMMRNFESKVA